MSAISSITLLNAFAVTDLAALQEKTVRLGYREVDTSIDGPRVTSPSICSIALPVSCVSSSTLRFVVNCETLLLAGPGDPQGVAAVQYRPHRCFPRLRPCMKIRGLYLDVRGHNTRVAEQHSAKKKK